MPFKLVGLTQLGQASFGGASIAQVTLPVAQQLTHKRGAFDQISVASAGGVAEETLKRRIEKVLPPSARVETATENADRSSEEIRENLGFLQTILLVFGYVAVLVGAFIIFNTFSITVAQRVSEFGVLRTLGASRRQILTSVLLEAGGDRAARRDRRAGGWLRRSPPGCAARSPPSAPTCRPPALVLEAPHRARLLPGRLRSSPSSRRWSRPGARPGCRRSPRCNAFTPAASRRRRLVLLVARRAPYAIGVAFVVAGLAGGGGIGARAARIGGGGLAVVVAVSLFSPQPGADPSPTSSVGRWSGCAG